jgi:hypothetical protein
LLKIARIGRKKRKTSMKWFWFPIAVVATSLTLVVALTAFFGLRMGTALASTLGASGPPAGVPWSGAWHGGPWASGSGFTLPAELKGLADIPPDQRFSHFTGVQITLKDKNNQPLTIAVTPGTVTAASATSLTIAANDGTSKTFTLDANTIVHTSATPSDGQATTTPPSNGSAVIVVTLNNSSTATAVVEGGAHGFGPRGPGNSWGPFGPGR